jgi:uncharacterized membrane protein
MHGRHAAEMPNCYMKLISQQRTSNYVVLFMENQKSKDIALGAGLGIIFGAVFGSVAIGLVIGAALGTIVGPSIRKLIEPGSE